jgi:hypothetical protein
MNGNEKRMKLGLAWYRENQWELLKKVSVDSAHLESTYREWEEYAIKLELDLLISGNAHERVDIDVNKLVEWCKSNNKPINGESRSEYVAVLLKTGQFS